MLFTVSSNVYFLTLLLRVPINTCEVISNPKKNFDFLFRALSNFSLQRVKNASWKHKTKKVTRQCFCFPLVRDGSSHKYTLHDKVQEAARCFWLPGYMHAKYKFKWTTKSQVGRQIHSIQTSLYIFRSNVDCRDVTYDLCTTASKARFARIKELVTQGRGSLVRQTNKSGNKRLQDNCAERTEYTASHWKK